MRMAMPCSLERNGADALPSRAVEARLRLLLLVLSLCSLSEWPTSASASAVGSGERHVCEDKLDDCSHYAGRGPLGRGCERHPEYMRSYCPRSCGFCEDAPGDASSTGSSVADRLSGWISGLASEDGRGAAEPAQRVGRQGPAVREATVALAAGESARLLSSRGVRRWHFLELPVRGASAPEESCTTDEASCIGTKAGRRTHAVAAHYYDGRTHALESWVYRWGFDRFEEHQALPTVGAWGLASVEVDGGIYLAMANFFDGKTRALSSIIYRWDERTDGFELHQSVDTVGASDVDAISLGSDDAFIAFAGSGERGASTAGGRSAPRGGAAAPGDESAVAESVVMRWNGTHFHQFQTLQSASPVFDVEVFFSVGLGQEELFLLLVHESNVELHRMSTARGDAAEEERALSLAQELDIAHGRDAEHYRLGDRDFVALAVFRGERSYDAFCRIFALDVEVAAGSARLREIQQLPAQGAFDVEFVWGASTLQEPTLMVASQRSGAAQLHRLDNSSDKHADDVTPAWTAVASVAMASAFDLTWHRVAEQGGAMHLGLARYWD
eukprot:TRINITY_DN31147_c0_g1_i1.p1 TRINITY_DN31147_c0_g1~~TRINITY_DN31147_c0_g1_i1.p1  ORF type:complete len:557 (-),score=117.31 TRINITY_DN31147_c0_g1_i1:6-1676(-)